MSPLSLVPAPPLSATAPVGRVIATVEDLAALEPAWWDLFARSPAAGPFQSPAWLLPWWMTFAPGPLRAVAVERSDRLLALAPLWLEDGPHGRRLLPIGIGITDTADILCDAGEPEALPVLAQALDAVQDWEMLALEDLPDGAVARDMPLLASWSVEEREQAVCPALDLGPGTDAVPADRRRKIRRAIRACQTRGGFVVETVTDAFDEFLQTLFTLHESRWSDRGEPGVVADPRVRAFHRAALPRLAAAGFARCYRLDLDGRPAAAWYGLSARGTTCAYLGGFDPAFSAESPGSVLMMHAIGEAVRAGDRTFDFLRGAEDYKYRFGATDRRALCRLVTRTLT